MFKILALLIITNFYSDKIDGLPPGTVHLKDNIYIDTDVVSVVAWKEYVLVNLKNGSKPFYPDTSYLVNDKNYYLSEDFHEEPVLKISFKAAQAYCKWRGDFINKVLDKYSKKSTCKGTFYVKNFKKKNFKLIYRLTTKEEYDLAISKGIIKNVKIPELFSKSDYNGKMTFRCVAEVFYE